MEIFAQRPTYSVGFCDDVVIYIPSGPPRKEEMDGITTAVAALRERRKRPVALLLFVPKDAASPQGSDYAVAKAGFHQLAEDLCVSSWVMEGSGFLAAAKRGLTTFLTSALLGKIPTKVFGTLEEGAEWLEPQAKKLSLKCPSPAVLADSVRALNDDMLFRQKKRA